MEMSKARMEILSKVGSDDVRDLIQGITVLQAKLAAVTPFIQEIMDVHADPNEADYNECDTSPCAWCEGVREALQEQEAGCKVCGLPEWDHHHGDERHEYKRRG